MAPTPRRHHGETNIVPGQWGKNTIRTYVNYTAGFPQGSTPAAIPLAFPRAPAPASFPHGSTPAACRYMPFAFPRAGRGLSPRINPRFLLRRAPVRPSLPPPSPPSEKTSKSQRRRRRRQSAYRPSAPCPLPSSRPLPWVLVLRSGFGVLGSVFNDVRCNSELGCFAQRILICRNVPKDACTLQSGCRQVGLMTFAMPARLCWAQNIRAFESGGPKDARRGQSLTMHLPEISGVLMLGRA